MNELIDRLIYDMIEEYIPVFEQETDRLLRTNISEYVIISNSSGIVSGTEILQRMLNIVDDSIVIKIINPNGSMIEENDIIAILSGKTTSIIKVIPLVQIIIESMSSIATTTYNLRRYFGSDTVPLYDDGVFTPLFQPLERLAFLHGGGSDFNQTFPNSTLLNKEYTNQVVNLNQSIAELVQSIDHYLFLIVEVSTFEEYNAAIVSDCDMIVLCDFDVAVLQQIFNPQIYDKQQLIKGWYKEDQLSILSSLHPDGIVITRLHSMIQPFTIDITRTR